MFTGPTFTSSGNRSGPIEATSRELQISNFEQLALSKKSGVVEVPDRFRVSFAMARFVAALGCLLTVLLMVVTVVVIMLSLFQHIRWQNWAGPLGIAFLVRLVLLGVPVWAELRTVGVIAKSRPIPAGFVGLESVGVEPAETYHRVKLLADEVGVLRHDVAGRRLLIDGLSHRYLICAPDVVKMELGSVKLGSGVRLDVRVGSSTLAFVISSRLGGQQSQVEPNLDSRVMFARRLARTLQLQLPDTTF
jgi:hypothetical protein